MPDLWLHSRGSATPLRHQLVPPGPCTIGRAPGHALVLPDRAVSRLHATLLWAEQPGGQGSWLISDAGSAGGTRVNGVRLQPGHSLTLTHADLLEIGPWTFEVVDRSLAGSADATIVLSDKDDAAEDAVQKVEVAEPAAFAQDQLLKLLDASERIHRAPDERAACESLVESVVASTGFQNVAFVKSDIDAQSVELVAARGHVVDRFGRAAISRSVLRKAHFGPVVMRDSGQGANALNATLASMQVRRAICLPVEHGAALFGFLYLDDREGVCKDSQLNDLASVAHALVRMAALSLAHQARARMEQRLEGEQRLMFEGTLHALIAAIDAKDPYTRGHSDRVSAFSRLLAEAAQLGPQMMETARLCGLVHDIGKIGVPESVLRKPSKLTDEEFATIAAHPSIGHEILRDIPQMREVLPGVLEHHEKWDGSGYPGKLKGDQISLLGRVVCIADCFDAMTSARTYRPARPISEVFDEIRRCTGTHFDPELSKAFLSIPEATLVQHMARPVVPATVSISPPTRVAA